MSLEFKDYFSAGSRSYAIYRPRYPAALFAYLASRAPAANQAWDCGTGTGQTAVALAEHFSDEFATDASESQIGEAQAHPRVTYEVAPAERSGLAGDSMDLVAVSQALHGFDTDRYREEVGEDPVELMQGRLLAAWGDPGIVREVRWPLTVRIGTSATDSVQGGNA